MNIENKTILAIAPHFDDIELGCFGTLHKLSSKNTIYYLGLSFSNDLDREVFLQNSVHKSLDSLSTPHNNLLVFDYDPRDFSKDCAKILQNLHDINKKINPDIIFIPSSYDIHQAHQVVHEEALRIFKNKTIFGYEFPWNNYSYHPDVFVSLNQENIEAKEKAISYFPSHGKDSFFENNIIRDLACLRGKQIKKELAESFELIRLICD